MKLFIRLKLVDPYSIKDMITRIKYEKYGFKKADVLFHMAYVELEEYGYKYVETHYKSLMDVNESESARIKMLITRKKIIGK